MCRKAGYIKLTPEKLSWLKETFSDEENFILADTLGISESTLHRYARKFGLKKSKAYMRRCQKEATDAAHYFNKISGRNKRLSEYMKTNMSEKFRALSFTKESNGWTRFPEKMRQAKAKCGAALHLRWEEERQRVKAGLPQRTRLRVSDGSTKEELQDRAKRKYYLKSRGYRLDGFTAYWNENTHRATILEKRDTMYKYRMEI